MPVSRNKRERVRIQTSGSVSNVNSNYIETHFSKKVGNAMVRFKRAMARIVGIKQPNIDSIKPARQGVYFNMSISYVGGGELEGIINDDTFDVVVHARNRANLIRKVQRVLHERHGIKNPQVLLPKPTRRVECVVV